MLCLMGITAQSSAQDTTSVHRHELGFKLGYKAGRLTPGLQYYYQLNPKGQLGFNLNLTPLTWPNAPRILSSEFAVSYRWKQHLFKGLYLFTEPRLSYQLLTIPGVLPRHEWGIGANSGLEYAFNKEKFPIVLGMGVQTMATYSAGRFGYNISPNLSLRFRF